MPGVGQGFFDDQDPTTYRVGNDPGPTFVIPVAGTPGAVTVNAGSSDLTLISGINGPDPEISTIPSSGGLDPVAAFPFSAGDGFEDLVVGNSGDGKVALFEGDANGLSLAPEQQEPILPDLTALALLAVTSGQVEFFAATAGIEAVYAITMNLGAATSSPPRAPGLQLGPLEGSSLPLVATIVSLTIEPAGEETDLGPAPIDEETDIASPGAAISVGQGFSLRSTDLGAEGDGPESPNELGQSAVPVASPSWDRFFLGLDEAHPEAPREAALDRAGPR